MKRLFSVTILILLYQSVSGQPNDINSFLENSYDTNVIKVNKIDTVFAVRNYKDKKTIFVFSFNVSGGLIDALEFDETGVNSNAYKYQYNKEGRLRSVLHYKIADSREEIIDSVVLSYNKSGLLEKIVKITLPNNKLTMVYRYENQKVIEDAIDMGGNKIINRYKYNSKGQLTNATGVYLEKGKKEAITSLKSFSYDALGRISYKSDSATSPFSYTAYTSTYFYHDNKLLWSIDNTNGSHYSFFYNKENLLERKEFTEAGWLEFGSSGIEAYEYTKRK